MEYFANFSILDGMLPFVVTTIDFAAEFLYQISAISDKSSRKKVSPPVRDMFLRQLPLDEAIFSVCSVVSSFSPFVKSTKQCGHFALHLCVTNCVRNTGSLCEISALYKLGIIFHSGFINFSVSINIYCYFRRKLLISQFYC